MDSVRVTDKSIKDITGAARMMREEYISNPSFAACFHLTIETFLRERKVMEEWEYKDMATGISDRIFGVDICE